MEIIVTSWHCHELGRPSISHHASAGLGAGVLMYPVKLVLGQWYLVCTCTRCQTLIPVFHDLSNGESELNGTYSMICPRCNHSGVYDVEHYQHHDRRKPEILIEIL